MKCVRLMLGLILFLIIQTTSQAQEQKKYNVLILMADDMNDWIGCYNGHPNTKTPNIDAFAKTAMRFSNAHCSVALCNSSRISMWTGLAPWESRIFGNYEWFRDYNDLSNTITLQQAFMQNGYKTRGSGKVFHKERGTLSDKVSWNEYSPFGVGAWPPDPTISMQHSHTQDQKAFHFVRHADYAPTMLKNKDTADFKNAVWIGSRLKNTYKKPFFMVYGGFLPHLPWYVPQYFFDIHPIENILLPPILDTDLDDLSISARRQARPDLIDEVFRKHGVVKELIQAYLASISYADHCIGEVLKSLDANPKYRDNTIVIVTSDHGWHLGEKRTWSKHKPWERANRVPFLIRIPGITTPNSVCDQPISLMDIYPTLIEVCGISPPHKLAGESLVPLFIDPQLNTNRKVISTSVTADYFSIRSYQYRYIKYLTGGKEEELYDMINDPNEWINLSSDPNYIGIMEEFRQVTPAGNMLMRAILRNSKGELK